MIAPPSAVIYLWWYLLTFWPAMKPGGEPQIVLLSPYRFNNTSIQRPAFKLPQTQISKQSTKTGQPAKNQPQ
jgi:hypothetical protein